MISDSKIVANKLNRQQSENNCVGKHPWPDIGIALHITISPSCSATGRRCAGRAGARRPPRARTP
jgi:hypothetical protein